MLNLDSSSLAPPSDSSSLLLPESESSNRFGLSTLMSTSCLTFLLPFISCVCLREPALRFSIVVIVLRRILEFHISIRFIWKYFENVGDCVPCKSTLSRFGSWVVICFRREYPSTSSKSSKATHRCLAKILKTHHISALESLNSGWDTGEHFGFFYISNHNA